MATEQHEKYMRLALKQAQIAFDKGEIPVGAVVVANHKVMAKAYNQVQMLKDPTAHAEILAITAACAAMGSKYLPDVTLYVTLEPCTMCAGAIKWAQINTVVYGASDAKAGFSAFTNGLFPKSVKIVSGILADESHKLMLDFFHRLRTMH